MRYRYRIIANADGRFRILRRHRWWFTWSTNCLEFATSEEASKALLEQQDRDLKDYRSKQWSVVLEDR